MKTVKVILAVMTCLLTACVPEIDNENKTASENLDKSKSIGFISEYGIPDPDRHGYSYAFVDVRHVVDSNGCDFIVASITARSSGAAVSIIHSPTCGCLKK